MKLLNSTSFHGWVQACANGRVGGMGGFIDGYGWFYGMGGFIDGCVGCRNGKVV
jgi:hypothetical protein